MRARRTQQRREEAEITSPAQSLHSQRDRPSCTDTEGHIKNHGHGERHNVQTRRKRTRILQETATRRIERSTCRTLTSASVASAVCSGKHVAICANAGGKTRQGGCAMGAFEQPTQSKRAHYKQWNETAKEGWRTHQDSVLMVHILRGGRPKKLPSREPSTPRTA